MADEQKNYLAEFLRAAKWKNSKETTKEQWDRMIADLQALRNGQVPEDAIEEVQKQAEEAEKATKDIPRMQIPAVYVDTWHATYWGGHVRLAFGERSAYDEKYWRVAILLEAKDLMKLIDRLQSVLKEIQPQKPSGDGG